MIVEEECPQTISKTLEDEINDFFSNPSKSPRFMLGPMKESLDIQKEFEKLIDLWQLFIFFRIFLSNDLIKIWIYAWFKL